MGSAMTTAATSSEPAVDPGGWWRRFRRWPRAGRWATYVAVAMALLLVATAIGVTLLVRRPLPQTSGTLEVPGLQGTVEVVRDDHGIPQLYADDLDDLVMAQGYVHAQERFFEMDLRRHVTSGRLSELFGKRTLETDMYIRTLGWRRVAEREVALVKPETRRLLQAYADGVNAYLDTHAPTDIAVQYTLLAAQGLRYTPEPWTPADSLAWLKAMAWDLRGNMDDEISRALLGDDHTAEEVASLFPRYPYARHQPIVTTGEVVDGAFDQDAAPTARRPAYPAAVLRQLRELHTALGSLPELLGRGAGLGSNSWVVDGAHSETGEPILANDPHLGVSLPGIWMQMGLHCRTVDDDCPLDVAGFTFSGVPGVIIGHNADIAWGFTNLGPDVTDLYLEQVRDDTWRRGRRWLPLQVRTETIEVRGDDDFQLRVRETAHGPLLSDVSQELATVGANAAPAGVPSYAVALAWTALTPSRTADAILGLDLASDWSEFRAAASDFAVPAQNLVYADREGHIGYQAPGMVPIRQPGHTGRVPVKGWLRSNDWTGRYVPFEALPHVLDPAEGFIVTANQAVIGPGYPYFLTSDWDQGYRSQRIRDLLEEKGTLSVGDMNTLQLDDLNPMAATLLPYLLAIDDLGSAYFRDGQALLRDWDGRQPADSAAAAYYNAVWSALLRLTFHDDLRESQWPDGGDRWFAVMTRLLERPNDPWWDDAETDDVIETRDDILRRAMQDARDELTKRESLDPDDWTWGAVHRLDLVEGTVGGSGIGPVEALVNRTGYPVAGGGSIVDATSWNAAEGFTVTAAPSMRMVVSLADFDDSRWINLTGVSGHPTSSHYVDQTDLYVAGETLPWRWSSGAVHEAGEDVLTLEPAKDG
jgi:penicillin G amidase